MNGSTQKLTKLTAKRHNNDTTMTLNEKDCIVLNYLIRTNKINLKIVINWASTYYADTETDSLIKEIALADSTREVLELINNKFQILENPDDDFLIGEVAYQYFHQQMSLQSAISTILFRLEVELSQEEKDALYLAEDFYGWHKSPDQVALLQVLPLLQRYQAIYVQAMSKFNFFKR